MIVSYLMQVSKMMDSSISVIHSSQHLSIVNNNINKDNIYKWASFTTSVVCEIVKMKSAVLHSYYSEYELPSDLVGEIHILKSKHGDRMYFMASCNAWAESDLSEILEGHEFESSTLWFQILQKTEQIDLEQINPVPFIETVSEISLGNEMTARDDECVGCVADGSELFWLNPGKAEVEILLNKLDELCSDNGLYLQRTN